MFNFLIWLSILEIRILGIILSGMAASASQSVFVFSFKKRFSNYYFFKLYFLASLSCFILLLVGCLNFHRKRF